MNGKITINLPSEMISYIDDLPGNNRSEKVTMLVEDFRRRDDEDKRQRHGDWSSPTTPETDTTCVFCETRQKLREMMTTLEAVPEIGSALYDDALTDAYNALDHAVGIWGCYCEEESRRTGQSIYCTAPVSPL